MLGHLGLRERFGRFALGLAHAGETHLRRLPCGCLLLGNQRLQRAQFFLGTLGFRHHFNFSLDRTLGFFQQANVIRLVDEVLLPLSQRQVSKALGLECADELLGDVALFGAFNDGQQQLKTVVLRGLGLLGFQPPSQFGEVGLKLQALLLGLGCNVGCFHLANLRGLQLVNEITGLRVTL